MNRDPRAGEALTRIGAPPQLWQPLLSALSTRSTSGLSEDLAQQIKSFHTIAVWEPARFPGRDGVVLDGGLWRHLGSAPRPLVVIPAAWGATWQQFAPMAFRLSLQGYDVLAYNPRGFYQSGGTIDVGGPDDWADGSAAIDHATARAGAEVTAVGFVGDSYGSGISLMVGATDERVDAVAALSAWGNLGSCLYEHDTRHLRAFNALIGATLNKEGEVIGRFDEATEELLEDYLANRNVDRLLEWGRVRSPEDHLEALNRRQLPVLISSHWHETLFPPNQLLRTFNQLTGPKRLLMSIGDHSCSELPGIAGLPNRVMDEAYRWLAHYLKGDANGADSLLQVSNEIMFSYLTVPTPDPATGLPTGPNLIIRPAAVEERKSWADVTGRIEQLHLKPAARPEFLFPEDGELSPGLSGTWTQSFTTGVDAGLTAADNPVFTGLAESLGNPKRYETRWFDRTCAAVWKTGLLGAPMSLRGAPRLRLTFTPSSSSTTLVVYLFDVEPVLGTARIITHEAFSFLDATPDASVSSELELQATGYDVPAGHRIMLVLDSVDQLYADVADGRVGEVTVSSSSRQPTVLELPLGDD